MEWEGDSVELAVSTASARNYPPRRDNFGLGKAGAPLVKTTNL